MITLPNILKRFQRQIEKDKTRIIASEVEFSGGTYQIQVLDHKLNTEEWVFLQLDNHGRLKDHFCSCQESEKGRGCIHQAIAYSHIYGSYTIPLHIRFNRSLWNYLCKYCAEQVPGTAPDILMVASPGHILCRTPNKKILISIKSNTPQTTEAIQKLLLDREEQTEETSLKFSNLSPEEIESWQRGKASPQLAYELSFWSDLAKYLLSLQELEVPYTIKFNIGNKQLPSDLIVTFPEFTIEWTLSNEGLIEIIPSLTTVHSPLGVYYTTQTPFTEITYDKEKLHFVPSLAKQKEPPKAVKGINIGDWTYVPDKGFYSQIHQSPIEIDDLKNVEALLNENSETLRSLISNCLIGTIPMAVSYELSFDDQNNLHIQEYLFTSGDLLLPGSHIFGSWVYIDDKGFFHFEERYFDEIETIIPAEEIGSFISQHKNWLNSQIGFATHVSPIESNLTYSLDKENTLSFACSLPVGNDRPKQIDFDRWIYIPSEGFYSKTSMQTSLPLQSKMHITENQLPLFIRRNREELQLVQGFFSNKCPLSKVRINIHLVNSEQIAVTPEYELLPAYANKEVRFFGNISFVEGEGFYELEPHLQLPEQYSHPVTIEGEQITDFLNNDLDKLLPLAHSVDAQLRKASSLRLIANHIDCKENEGIRNYSLKLNFESELGSLSLASLWHAFQQGKRFVLSEAGLIDLSDKRYGWLKTLAKNKVNRKNDQLLLSSVEVLKLNVIEEINLPPSEEKLNTSSLKLFKELTELHAPDEPDLQGLKSHLRPYQQTGVNWLWFLYHHGLSGLLCDDMGLGKTHQSMALLAACTNYWKKREPGKKRHFLIICPTSVIYHWQDKLKEFLPNLKVWTFHGSKRTLEGFQEDYDILLTSYGIWRNEVKMLSKIKFDIAIFDELQIAKNQSSRIYHTLLKTNARMRLGMTGTPIENNLGELKALFDLVLPSYMPSESDFRDFFVRTIEKEGDLKRKQLLARLIKPFVLRRKKEDVLLDLPEKIEELSHCELSENQQQLYIEVLSSSREKILDELRDGHNPIPYMHIFALLANLKQICNHPAAFLKTPAEYQKYQSGKWDLFVELLEEARESGQKVVVFSQYLNMLDIIEHYLKENKIGYAAIRGATTDRGKHLKRFNEDPTCEVFVASLQAAGLGIDLTAASVVIHYDRWWNAARENQATDRVHRIGQKRGVQVFKLITKNTLEEHINFMIAKKGRLMDDIISIDDHQIVKKFTREELIELLHIIP